MPDYLKTETIESQGRSLSVTACDPEIYDETVQDCTVRVKVDGRSSVDKDAFERDGADAGAVDAWLEETYYPWVHTLVQEEALDAAAEDLHESREAYRDRYAIDDADFP